MSDSQIDDGKRTWLIASSCAGVVGGAFVAVPFISSVQPSERARAAGAAVEVDIGGMKPGEVVTVEWRGKPVWIVKRTPAQLETLKKLDPLLADPMSARKPDELTPEYARNSYRSIKPEVLVAVGICTHLAARLPRSFSPARRPPCLTTGRAVSCAHATVPPSTWPAGSTRTSLHPTTLRCPHTCTCRTAG